MTTQQAELTAGRIIRIDTTQNSPDPEDDPSTDPDLTLSPLSPTAGRTSGFLLMLKQPSSGAAVPSGPGDTFTVTIWIRNPVTKVWGAGDSIAIGYNQAFVTGDIDAAELYFQIGNVDSAGDIDLHLSEQAHGGRGGLRRAFAASSGGGGGGGGGTPFADTSTIRWDAVAANTYTIDAGAVETEYFSIVNQSDANLFVHLGSGVTTTPGSELATVILPPGVYAGYEVFGYRGLIYFQFDADDADGYALTTIGVAI